MLERRTVLAGLAALPMAGLPLAAVAAAAHADPFATYHHEILAVQAEVDGLPRGSSDDDLDRLMVRWGEIDAEALTARPTTLAGALGALELARREYVQFQLDESEVTDDPSERLVLHLMDGAIGVLRRATGGGVA